MYIGFFFFTNIFIYPSRSFLMTHRPHPCYIRESVGSILTYLQHMNPTLTTNASWWGHFLVLQHRPHPHYKCELVGSILTFITHKPHPHYKCKLVGSILTLTTHEPPPPLATNASQWDLLGHFTQQQPQDAHPHSKHELVDTETLR